MADPEPNLPGKLRDVALAWMAYVVIFSLGHETILNDGAAVFLLVPLLVGAWHFALPGGLIGAVIMWPVQTALFLLGDHELGWSAVAGPEGAVALSGLSVMSVVAGWGRSRLLRLEAQARVKDRFVAAVSHEVRNPLTGVVGLAEILRDDWDELDDAMRRELVERIVAGAVDMSAIIEDLLDLTRLGTGRLSVELAPVELGAELVAAVAPDGQEVAVDGSARVMGDAARVRQIARNLLANAVRHGGERVLLRVEESGRHGSLEVWDDGAGPAPDLREHMFAPFASSGGEGTTGLGLSVSRELARAMGGDLSFRREDGWTVFRLELPAASRQAAPA